MKITVRKAAQDVYSLTFDDVEVALDGEDLKSLLLRAARVLSPGDESMKSAEEKAREFLRRIKNANDVAIQKLLLLVDHEDVLVLLKFAENDKALMRKFYGNMSERSRKITVEDMVYKFPRGVPEEQTAAAIRRLAGAAKELEDEGTLIYENVVKR